MYGVRVKPITFEVPFTPPSVNHYKKPVKIRTRDGMRQSFALTDEAIAWRNTIAVFAKGASLIPAKASERDQIRYTLTATVYLGKNQRGGSIRTPECESGISKSSTMSARTHVPGSPPLSGPKT